MLHRISDAEQREAEWRQSIATLASAVVDQRRPVPLEGLNPEELLRSADAAIRHGYVNKLDWLSGPAAGAALYEIAAALPASPAKREIGRLVFERLHVGDAATFVALATQLALGSPRALRGHGMRARVTLALNLPLGMVPHTDALALALISRRELSREWLVVPATGSLASRRLAARLLERAAREAARKAAEGDDSGVRVFTTEAVRDAWDRLLADRESLVWRHVASARGLLSSAMPAFHEEVQRHLSVEFSITEWRRAAASLATSIALKPKQALTACRDLLDSEVFKKDQGIAGAMIVGLPRAAEGQPEVVEELLAQLVQVRRVDMAEALVDLRRESAMEGFADAAAKQAEDDLRHAIAKGDEDEGNIALMSALADELSGKNAEPTLGERLALALQAFAKENANAAFRFADAALRNARRRVEQLEENDVDTVEGRQREFLALRELDMALFETDALSNLLMLGHRDEASWHKDHRLGDIFQRITNWLVIREGDPIREAGRVPHFTTRIRQLRTMLHLVDADGNHIDSRQDLVKQRRTLSTRVLLGRSRDDADSPLRRALSAATARACDGLVRDELAEVSDIVVAAAAYVTHPMGLSTMAEASMEPAIETAFRAYSKFQEGVKAAADTGSGLRPALDALQTLGNDLPVARSPRVEALRGALMGLMRALRQIAASSSLTEIAERSQGTPLAALEQAVGSMAQLVAGAQRRLGLASANTPPRSAKMIRGVGVEVERALRSSVSELDRACQDSMPVVMAELPGAFASVTALALDHIRSLPLDAPRRADSSSPPPPEGEAPLPAWVPPGRTLGGFYVVRSIGTGAAGSVFIARRSEARNEESAEAFALKVPDYSGAAARTLSEEEFLRLFREEAGALLSLPEHPNIARFVTFDVGARPKPILVMELVRGPSMERMIEMSDFSMRSAVDLLLGVGAGLDAMHQVGVSHLDVKPSNIIVRDGGESEDKTSGPVLVDFGLAGRNLRPGCGTAQYGAPEIWGAGDASQAIPADVYAFGCLIYEALTGTTLFEGPNEMSLIALHVTHDGGPPSVAALNQMPETEKLGQLLHRCLRKDPADRITIRQSRQFLAELRDDLEALPWPLRVA